MVQVLVHLSSVNSLYIHTSKCLPFAILNLSILQHIIHMNNHKPIHLMQGKQLIEPFWFCSSVSEPILLPTTYKTKSLRLLQGCSSSS